jgi:small subunit ribosomal protein S6
MNDKTHTYEAMFVLSTAGGDFEAASEPIRAILTRYEGEVLMLKCWDERKLAYDIHGHKRGLYALSFFKAPPARVAEIEHDCQLDERFLRVLILRRDRLTAEEIEREKTSTAKPPSAPEPEARAAEGERRYGGRGRPRRPERMAEPAPEPEPAEETEPTEGGEGESPNGDADTNGEA